MAIKFLDYTGLLELIKKISEKYLKKTDISGWAKASTKPKYNWKDLDGLHRSVSSLSGLLLNVNLITCNTNTNQTLSISTSETLPVGKSVHIIIHNTGGSDITISFPSPSSKIVISGKSSFKIKSGQCGEVNIVSDGSVYYLRGI